MSVIKLDKDKYTPLEVLDYVAKTDPKSVLVMWIDHAGKIHMGNDSTVTMQNFAYYNKALDIWTADVLLNG